MTSTVRTIERAATGARSPEDSRLRPPLERAHGCTGPMRGATGTFRRGTHEVAGSESAGSLCARRDHPAVDARTPDGPEEIEVPSGSRSPSATSRGVGRRTCREAGALFTRPGKALRREPSARERLRAPTNDGSAPPRPTFAATSLELSAKRVTREQEFPRASSFNLPPKNTRFKPKTRRIVAFFSTGYEPEPCRLFGVSAT